MSPKVKYVGGHDSVDVVLPDGSTVTCEHQHEIEVDAPTRDSLLSQNDGNNWTEIKRDSASASSSSAPAAGKEK